MQATYSPDMIIQQPSRSQSWLTAKLMGQTRDSAETGDLIEDYESQQADPQNISMRLDLRLAKKADTLIATKSFSWADHSHLRL